MNGKTVLFAALILAATSCIKVVPAKPIIVKSDTGSTFVIGTPLLLPK